MNSYLKFLATLVFAFCIHTASAQFGARVKYNMNSFSGWNNYLDQSISGDIDKIFPSTLEVGVDYWFRLKNHRIEFMPEIAMGLKSSSSYQNIGLNNDFSYFAFNFNTQIYAFDLTGDCDCPTFSKQGPALNKGFFFNIAPGILYHSKETTRESLTETFESNQVSIRLGLGIGYDIGISDLFTITPAINYNIAPGLAYDELADIVSPNPSAPDVSSTLNQIQFQLRLGFRPDYVKSYGRGRR